MSLIRNFINTVKDKSNFEFIKRKSPKEIAYAAQKLAANKKYKKAWGMLDLGIALYPRNPEIILMMQAIPNHYDDKFYEEQQAGSMNSARETLKVLRELYQFDSVVDFGAGVGTWLKIAEDYGSKEMVGVEAEWVKENKNKFSGANYIYTDLNAPISLSRRFDLAISVEVAEHLNPDRSQGLVEEICRSSDIVVFGAAMPRQRGSAHINGRPQSFWVELFQKQGYECLDLFRPNIWNNPLVEPWYAQNTFLFVASAVRKNFSPIPIASLLNIYHPLLIDELVKADVKAGVWDPTSPS